MKRPLFVTGFAFGGCLLAARLMGFHAALIATAIGALLFLLALIMRSLRGKTALLAALLSAVAAFSIFAAREHLVMRPLQRLNGHTVSATVWLTDELAVYDGATLYSARVMAGELPANTRLLWLVQDGEDAPELYNLAEADFFLAATDDYRADGLYLRGWAGDWTVSITSERPWNAPLTAWRKSVMAHVDEKADGEVAGLIRAVCFGDKSGLSMETRDAFSAAGLSHLTAVSGFHMSVIALGFFGLLCLLRVKRRLAAVLSLPLPLLFAALTGFSYSALRAGFMCLLVMLAAVARRRADAQNSLGGAMLLLLLIDPNAIYDLGFLLSVASTLGIVCTMRWGKPPAEDAPPPKRAAESLWAAVRVTLTATAATLPIIALTFGRLSVLSPVSNLLGEPAASVIVVCGCVGTLLQSVPWLSFLASPLFLAAGLAARFLLWWAKWVASLPMAVWWLDRPYLLLWACAVPFALWLGWQLLRGRGLRLTAMLLVVALCAATLAHTLGMRGVTTLTMTDFSNGCALLLSRDGHHGLVLSGERGWETENFLTQQGIDRLDFVLYTKSETLTTADERTLPLGQCAAATFWDDSTATLQDGWLTLTIGGTRVLLCPAAGDAAALTPDEQMASLLIFDHAPPAHVTALAAGEAVVCCGAAEMNAVTKALPWGSYPIAVTADETVVLHTRGQGNIQG